MLFVVVTAVDDAGGFTLSRGLLERCAEFAAPWPALATGFAVVRRIERGQQLPVGLNLGDTLPAMHASALTARPRLIGVNLGPNASVNGSLATLLWLAIVRRAGVEVSPVDVRTRRASSTAVPALVAALLLLRS